MKTYINIVSGVIVMIFMFLTMVVVGIVISALVGPVSLLFIKKVLKHDIKAGLSVAIGASAADTLYAFSASAGLTLLAPLFTRYMPLLKGSVGVLLIFLGFYELKRVHPVQKVALMKHRLMLKGFLLTLANPMTFFVFLAVFSMLNFSSPSVQELFLMTVGVFCGAMLWWYFLGKIAQRFSPAVQEKVYRYSCYLFLGFGVWTIMSVILGCGTRFFD